MADEPEKRGFLPADPRRDQTLADIGLPNLSLYKREDLMLIRSAARRGLLPVETMLRLQESLAMMVDDTNEKSRTRIAAFRALAPVWLGLLKLIGEVHGTGEPTQAAETITNNQIIIQLPQNGREGV